MATIPNTTLWISPSIMSELMFYAWKVDNEVGGYGLLEFDEKENDIFVRKLYLIEQEVSSSECTLKAEGTAKLYEELIAAGEGDKIKDLNFWWHSHKDMGVFFSGTDDTHIKEWPGKYLVSLVINRKGELKANVMSRVPIMVIGEVDVKINWYDVAQFDEWQKSIDEKVKKWTPPVHSQQVVVPGQQQFQYRGMQGTQRGYHDPYGWNEYDEEWRAWRFGDKKEKKLHDMTENEWNDAQDAVEREAKAWAEGDVDTIIDLNDMDDEEAAGIRAMFGG